MGIWSIHLTLASADHTSNDGFGHTASTALWLPRRPRSRRPAEKRARDQRTIMFPLGAARDAPAGQAPVRSPGRYLGGRQ